MPCSGQTLAGRASPWLCRGMTQHRFSGFRLTHSSQDLYSWRGGEGQGARRSQEAWTISPLLTALHSTFSVPAWKPFVFFGSLMLTGHPSSFITCLSSCIFISAGMWLQRKKRQLWFLPDSLVSCLCLQKALARERNVYSFKHPRKQTLPMSGNQVRQQGTHIRGIFSFVWEQMVPLGVQPRVGKEEGVRRNKWWCCNPVFFLFQGSMHPTLWAARPREGADSLQEGSKWDP